MQRGHWLLPEKCKLHFTKLLDGAPRGRHSDLELFVILLVGGWSQRKEFSCRQQTLRSIVSLC